MDEKQLVVDLDKLYLGIEECEMYVDGQLCNVKTFSLFSLMSKFECKNVKRYVLVNMETADEIIINENGFAVKYSSKNKDIKSVTGLKHFEEAVDDLLRDTAHFVEHMKDGKSSVEFFKKVQSHIDYCHKKKQPSFANLDCFMDILTAVPNMYTLCYGNPLTGQSQLECINEFRKER